MMKAAVLTAPEKIEIQEIQTPKITDEEVLVKLKDCGICTLEQRLYRGDMKIYYPIVPGHEASGEIVEVGKHVVGDFHVGLRVALDLVTRCGECYFCRIGKSNMCANRFNKGASVLGGFGEYIAVRAQQIFPISDDISFREAAFSEPVSCCIRSLKKIEISLAEDLLILGAGPMGIMHLQVALSMGARVFVSDPDAERLTTARELGAYKTIDPSSESLKDIILDETGGRGTDACVVTSSAKEALFGSFDVLAKTGRINIYTSYMDKPVLPIDANTLHRNEIMITGSEGRTEFDFHQAVRLICFQKIDVRPLISGVVSFGEIEKGIQEAMTSKTYRVLLEHEA
jgi:L-iditol 2-dehydrogenase